MSDRDRKFIVQMVRALIHHYWIEAKELYADEAAASDVSLEDDGVKSPWLYMRAEAKDDDS